MRKASKEMGQYGLRVALVTGGTGAIGKAIAQQIAENKEFEVVLLCRQAEKAKHAVSAIRRKTGNDNIRFELVDLSRYASILKFADRWKDPIHVLVNNAAVTPRTRQQSPEGIELQFATNVLGYFWLMRTLSEVLIHSAPARVVNVASYWAGGLDLNDLEFKHRTYRNGEAYRQSKQANRMLTVAFARRLKSYNVTVNVCHPGDVNSLLSNNLGFGGHETPEQAAKTPVWLAVNSIGRDRTGKYFEYLQERRCPFGEDKNAVEALYQACLRYS